jgi:hypothetical protein
MEGNIVGEPFEDFVAKQIDVRQKRQFNGKNTFRTDEDIQYLTNRNAWVKLASSVRIEQGPTLVVQQQITNTGQTTPAGTTGGLTGTVNVGFGSGGGLGAITNALSTITNTAVVNLSSKRLQKIFGNSSVVASNFPGTKLPESAVLFNTLSTYTGPKSTLNQRGGISKTNTLWNDTFAYGIGGTEFGIQPPPGIVSVQVDSLNRGSIRKANVAIKAHNRFQFDLIELLYLRLGFTMMLEWGWDRYLDDNGTLQEVRNTIIEKEWFSSNGISQLEMLSKIQAIREEYRGNVDGFFGKVSNFTWSFNPDGTYDITIDLITLGDVIESIKVNTPSKQKFSLSGTTQFTTPQEAEPFYGNIAEAATLTALGSYLFERVVYMKNNGADAITEITNGNESTNFIRVKPTIVQTGTGTAEDPITVNFNQDRYFYYIKLGHLLQNLQNYIIPQVVNGQSKKPQINISSDELLNIISYFPNQISLDPKVCVFNIDGALNSYGDITGITPPAQYFIDPYIETNSTTNLKYGKLMNLYINIEFISSLLISNGSSQELFLFKFLQDLCNGINDALGGVNKLEPVIKNDSTVVFIDQTLSIPVNDTVTLEVYGYNTKDQTSNFVKDIKFESKITPQLASMISIGATAAGTSTSEIDGTAFEKWNEELTDRFTQNIETPTFPETISSTTTNTADKTTYQTKFNKYLRSNRSPWVDFLYIVGITDPNAVKRRVNDPSYPFDGKAMDFNTFYSLASAHDEEQKRNNNFRPEDLKFLLDKNYGFWLVNAFGGTSDVISVTTSFTSQNGRTSSTKTERFTVDPLVARYFEFDSNFINQGKAAYKAYLNELNNNRFRETNFPSSEVGFIPLSFELVLDGISGIKIYNKLSINSEFLPSNYPNTLKFVITKVNHSISNNSWDTSLSTVSMPITTPYEYGKFPSPQGGSGSGSGAGSGASGGAGSGASGGSGGATATGNLDLLKDLITRLESGYSDPYAVANTGECGPGNKIYLSTTKVNTLTFEQLRQAMLIPEDDSTPCDKRRVFAAGRWQVIPLALFGRNWRTDINGGQFKRLGFSPGDIFNVENQEKIGNYLLLDSSVHPEIGQYLKGKTVTKGNQADLEKAVQKLSQMFTSFPTIKNANGAVVGDVVTGTGNKAYNVGGGVDSRDKSVTVADVVKILIQTRINYSGDSPEYIPAYY